MHSFAFIGRGCVNLNSMPLNHGLNVVQPTAVQMDTRENGTELELLSTHSKLFLYNQMQDYRTSCTWVSFKPCLVCQREKLKYRQFENLKLWETSRFSERHALSTHHIRWQSHWNGTLLLKCACPAPPREHSLDACFCPLICLNWEIHLTLCQAEWPQLVQPADALLCLQATFSAGTRERSDTTQLETGLRDAGQSGGHLFQQSRCNIRVPSLTKQVLKEKVSHVNEMVRKPYFHVQLPVSQPETLSFSSTPQHVYMPVSDLKVFGRLAGSRPQQLVGCLCSLLWMGSSLFLSLV